MDAAPFRFPPLLYRMLVNLLIATHHGAGGDHLLSAVSSHQLVAPVRTLDTVNYTTVKTIEDVRHRAAKARPQAQWAADLLLSNGRFTSRHLYPMCRFIFLVREPEGAIPAAVSAGRWTASNAARQYRFRLRRLAEMAVDNPGSLLLDYRDLATCGVSAVRDWLGFKHMTNTFRPLDGDPELVPWQAVRGARHRYDRYVGIMRRYCSVPSGSCLA